MFAVLISERGGQERRQVLEKNEVTVGRLRGNDLVLSKGNVSKRHARLTQKDGRYVVIDQNSTNGTYVNRQRIRQATIVRAGDRIYIGDFILRIEEPGGGVAGVSAAPGETLDRNWVAQAPEHDQALAGTQLEPSAADSPQEPGQQLVPPPPPGEVQPTSEGVEASAEIDSGSGTEAAPPVITDDQSAMAALVQRVESRLEPGALDAAVSEALERRVDRLLVQELDAIRPMLPVTIDSDALGAWGRAELLGWGPLQALVDRTELLQATLWGTGGVSYRASGGGYGLEPAPLVWAPVSSSARLRRLISRLCLASGVSAPAGWTVLGGDLGNRLRWSAVRSTPLDDGCVLTMRRRRELETSFDDLQSEGVVGDSLAQLLRQAVAARLSILVTGSAEASAPMLSALGAAAEDRRLVLVETEHHFAAVGGNRAVRLPADSEQAGRVLSVLAPDHCLIETLDVAGGRLVLDCAGQAALGLLVGAPGDSAELALSLASERLAWKEGRDAGLAQRLMLGVFDLVVEMGVAGGQPRAVRVAVRTESGDATAQLVDLLVWNAQSDAYDRPHSLDLLERRLMQRGLFAPPLTD